VPSSPPPFSELREQDPWPGTVLLSLGASILDIITTIASALIAAPLSTKAAMSINREIKNRLAHVCSGLEKISLFDRGTLQCVTWRRPRRA
jgi:hypothetical protein